METDFISVRKMACISRESVLLISALMKCLIYAISKNCSYDKALPKLPYLPDVFVFLINVGQFVIIEKGFFFFSSFDAG